MSKKFKRNPIFPFVFPFSDKYKQIEVYWNSYDDTTRIKFLDNFNDQPKCAKLDILQDLIYDLEEAYEFIREDEEY